MAHTILQLDYPSQYNLDQYSALAKALDYPALGGSGDGFLVVVDVAGTLVGAVTVMRPDSPYIYFEDFLLNPKFPAKVRHLAGELIAEQIIYICNAAGKVPMCPVTFQGGVNILKRYGFTGHMVMMMSREPGPIPVGEKEVSGGHKKFHQRPMRQRIT